MTLTLQCNHCLHKYRFKESYRGKKIRCKHCGETFKVQAIDLKRIETQTVERNISDETHTAEKKIRAAKISLSKPDPTREKLSKKRLSIQRAKKRLSRSRISFLVNQTFFAIVIVSVFTAIYHLNMQSRYRHHKKKMMTEQKASLDRDRKLFEKKLIERRKRIVAIKKYNERFKEPLVGSWNSLTPEDIQVEKEIFTKSVSALSNDLMKHQLQAMSTFQNQLSHLRTTIKNNRIEEKGLDGMQPAVDGFFTKHVVHILMNRCFKCHGNEEAKGGYRMHTRKLALAGGDSGAVVIPGNPDESLLVDLISLPEEDTDVMPPKNGTLSAEEISHIVTWIENGAKW